MKKIILLFCFALCAQIGFSQAKVFASGKTMIGDNTGMTDADEELHVIGIAKSEGNTVEATGASGTSLFERTDGAAMLVGAGSQAGFVFDENFAFQIRSRSRNFVLARALSAGTYLLTGNGQSGHIAMGYSSASATHRLRLNGSITGTGFTLPSDKKLKSNINDFKPGLAEVLQMNPITYVYNGMGGIDTKATQVGLFAQDLKKLAPVLVSEEDHYEMDEDTNQKKFIDSYLQINDTGIKYMLINAIKEQQEIIEAKEDRIQELESNFLKLEELVNGLAANGVSNTTDIVHESNVTLSSYDLAELDQNVPNPFSGETTISYVVPSNANNAKMNIFDFNGKLIKTVRIDHVGEGVLNIEAVGIPSGSYSYQLVVDNTVIAAKKMVVTK